MSQSVINYDPPSQQVPNIRTVYKIPRGIAVIPSTIKLLDILINPTDASGDKVTCYFPANSGIWSSIQQVELKVGDKPVDIFLSKQASAFRNTLGTPDLQNDIVSQLTGSSNNIYQDSTNQKEELIYNDVDSVSQCMEFNKILDYLNNRHIIDEGLSIMITWDSKMPVDWLLSPTATITSINIQPGYLSYESVLDHNLPKQDVVNFKQTIEEVILLPAITGGNNTTQQWEQRMNSLRGKYVSRVLFVNEPQADGIPDSIQNTFGRYCSMGQLAEFMNIVIDGQQKLTFKGFSNNAHKNGMLFDTFGPSSQSMAGWYLPKYDILDDFDAVSMSNYYSYLGAELDTFVDKELVIQYQRNNGTVSTPTFKNAMKLYMISEVWKQHDVNSGTTTYIKV